MGARRCSYWALGYTGQEDKYQQIHLASSEADLSMRKTGSQVIVNSAYTFLIDQDIYATKTTYRFWNPPFFFKVTKVVTKLFFYISKMYSVYSLSVYLCTSCKHCSLLYYNKQFSIFHPSPRRHMAGLCLAHSWPNGKT